MNVEKVALPRHFSQDHRMENNFGVFYYSLSTFLSNNF